MLRQMDELATDRPTASELLEIMAETLSDVVVPATAPHAQHQARVAANLCRILGRELAVGPATNTAPITLPPSLLDADDVVAQAAYDDVLTLVRAKLAVVKPGYDDHGAEQEQGIIA